MSDAQPLFVQQIDTAPHGTNGDATFTFRNTNGESVSVDLSPASQMYLVSLILANAKGQVVDGRFQLTRPPIRAYGFQPFVLSDDFAGLEIRIHEALAIHVGFDGATCEQLAEAVRTLTTPGPSTAG